SPITADLLVGQVTRLGAPSFVGGDLRWLESRPAEGGRTVVVARPADQAADLPVRDLLPPPFNARSRVHEYGGGAIMHAAAADPSHGAGTDRAGAAGAGRLWISNFADCVVYEVPADGSPPRPLTPVPAAGASPRWRYADGDYDARRRRLILVREDHGDSAAAPVNTIVALATDAATDMAANADGGRILVRGDDFYAAPRLDPAGRRLAWISWSHPDMPWDATRLWLADVADDGALENRRCVAGGAGQSVLEPRWSPDGVLHYISDQSGWWNLYRLGDHAGGRNLWPLAAEFCGPPWQFGGRHYGFLDDRRLLCIYSRDGQDRLALLPPDGGPGQDIDLPFTAIGDLCVAGHRAVFAAAGPRQPSGLWSLDLAVRAGPGAAAPMPQEIALSTRLALDPADISVARPLSFPTSDGDTAHGLFYPPANGRFSAPPDERPPLIVKSHGGPTGATSSALSLSIQYWTSRGFAVLDVNYRGSTGYGRPYRQRLEGQWGVYDVADCVAGAQHLADQGLVDGRRLAITGGSAGGYTTLAALCFHDVFRAGASHYGISDLETLAADTHKFESRYLDRLIGPLPAARDTYRARSPIHHASGFTCPVIFFQGLEDRVVPPDQARRMADALGERGLPVALVEFAGEGHGFRQAANIRRALEAELWFYGRVFGFCPADVIDPPTVANESALPPAPPFVPPAGSGSAA
ncbi:MAG: S9 family peptidase, partial [Alphaproteobacteria bacterium]